MQILLANAKIMYDKADKAPCSTPLFESVADKLAAPPGNILRLSSPEKYFSMA